MGKVEHVGRQEVGRGDWELLRRSLEFGGISWGDASRREVERGDWELLGRY